MRGRARVPFLRTAILLSFAGAPEAWAQPVPPPSSAGPAKPPAPAPATAAPPAAPAPATPPPPSTAAFPTAPTAATAAAPAPPSVPPTPAVEPHRRALVRFKANEVGATLESDTTPDGKQSPWYVVCEAPCQRSVSTAGVFRVSGPGYHPSRMFRLPDDRAELSVEAEMESSSIAVPMAITIVGGVIASVGGLMALSGYAAQQNHEDGEEFIVPGVIIGGAGTVLATIGAILLIVEAQDDESRAHVAEGARGLVF